MYDVWYYFVVIVCAFSVLRYMARLLKMVYFLKVCFFSLGWELLLGTQLLNHNMVVAQSHYQNKFQALYITQQLCLNGCLNL